MSNPRISFIVSAWGDRRPNALRCILASLVCQSIDDWEAIVIDSEYSETHDFYCRMDERILYRVHPSPNIYYGAEWAALEEAKGKFLAFPNDDGYYSPPFAERLLDAAELNNWDLVYSDIVLGGPSRHFLLQQQPHKCAIDKTGFIINRSCFDGFDSKDTNYQESDGIFIEKVVSRGIRHGAVREILAVHN